ncbi:prolipoprotein diacylglyceryl transferase [Stackebrandtia nassauensis]|uniref:Phosphatidylglycerol--prolipoprotein diacylglyceryl transferase n=1 Tax=Stackebrandtia nassauensis (strain DSM 44728 / CIP 108903 / NRRL B-16338 / NBRC 102104 / LLR-40K-21) TaxID=446470 RepID=D3Q620_STANL|nr:prolipoprotein diacylglyceryl transferase [Stackebrandtia nassauensis]ADD42195.1 prolipoprotein diacylglyceryl transferase [Stackebrandtia nassauensis DSM 44728]
MDYAYIPSPEQSVWEIPIPFTDLTVPLRAYALCIIAGIIAACWITEVRLRKRGAPPFTVLDLAVWAVPFGIIGGRLYHVITSPDAYFGSAPDANPWKAFAVWEGGLGIPGAVAMGGLGVWLACRRSQIPFSMIADALAPGLPVAQAIGRLGNWFNQELYGKPTTMPWGLEINPINQAELPEEYQGKAAYEPTFLYELIWNLGIAGLIVALDRKFKFGAGRAFAVYVLCYGVGRFWIEGRRIDPAHDFLGLRVNEWVAIAMIVGAVIYLLRVTGTRQVLVTGPDGLLTPVDWDKVPEPTTEDADETDADEADADEADADSDESEPDDVDEGGDDVLTDDDEETESSEEEEAEKPSGKDESKKS